MAEGLVPSLDDLAQLIEAAQKGDQLALAALRDAVDAERWQSLGGLAERAERELIAVACGKNLIRREALDQKLVTLRAELGGPQPSPLERLLVERIVACWLQVLIGEDSYARQLRRGDLSWATDSYHQRRLDQAQRRYLTAIKALAQVRRLLTPTVVNIAAQQQVNLGR